MLTAYSYSKKLEDISINRSFQNIYLTLWEVLNTVLRDIHGAYGVVNGKNNVIGRPLIQYEENDWDFIRRIAGRGNEVIYVDDACSYPCIAIGPYGNTIDCVFDNSSYGSGIDEGFFKQGGKQAGLHRSDFLYYEVNSTQNYPLGADTRFQNMRLTIYSKIVRYVNGELIFTYKLGSCGINTRIELFNPKMCGLSLEGTVISTDKETIKVRFDFDESQSIESAYSYEWTPISGNLMYCVPQVGTKAAVYMASKDEGSAKAVTCVRTNGSACRQMENYHDRRLQTEHGKSLKFNEAMLLFGSDEEGSRVLSLAEEQLCIKSDKPVLIAAAETISIEAASFGMSCYKELNLVQTGEAVSEASLSNPKSSFCCAGNQSYYGDHTVVVTNDEPDTYPPFEDSPQEASDLELIGELAKHVLAGAVVVGLVVVTLSTFGAAAPVLIGAAVGGAIGVGMLAYGDYKDGNCSSYFDYMLKGGSGAVSGAVCAKLAPCAGAGFWKYIWSSAVAGGVSGLADNLITMSFETLFDREDYSISDWVAGSLEAGISGGLAGALAGALSFGLARVFCGQASKLANGEYGNPMLYLVKKYDMTYSELPSSILGELYGGSTPKEVIDLFIRKPIRGLLALNELNASLTKCVYTTLKDSSKSAFNDYLIDEFYIKYSSKKIIDQSTELYDEYIYKYVN